MRLPAALLLALAASNFAWSDAAHPPARVAHLSYVEGELRFQGEETPATTALPDRPLRAGDRLRTARDGRAELALGTATIRLDEESELSVRRLDEKHTRIELAAGAAVVHLREFYEQEEFEIRAGNADIALLEPGEYRVDVSARDATAITVRTGAAEVESAVGPVRVAAGQRVSLDVRDGIARLESPPGADAFDDWVLERELQLADAEPPRYTPAEDGGSRSSTVMASGMTSRATGACGCRAITTGDSRLIGTVTGITPATAGAGSIPRPGASSPSTAGAGPTCITSIAGAGCPARDSVTGTSMTGKTRGPTGARAASRAIGRSAKMVRGLRAGRRIRMTYARAS